MKYVVLYLLTGAIFLAVDAAVLGSAGARIFRDVLGERMRASPNLTAAAAFYLIFAAGIVYFAGAPALNGGGWRAALINGALFGFFAYLTFEATSYAILEGWSVKLVVLDTLWGTALTGGSAAAAYALGRALGWLPAAG